MNIKLILPVLLLISAFMNNSFAVDQQISRPQNVITTQSDASKTSLIEEKVNINQATAHEIQRLLVGIGLKKAEAIVEYREKHGNFVELEQLLEVQGIGKATLEKNKNRIIL